MSDKSDSGVVITSGLQPSGPPEKNTITITEDGGIETMTIAGGQIWQTVVTIDGVPQTITVGPPMSCEYFSLIRGQLMNSNNI
jgi:hypothetical protein